MARRRNVVRLGIPALIVAVLTVVALWRVGAPVGRTSPAGTSPPERPNAPLGPLTTIAEVLAENAIGRRASLERVEIRQVVGPRTFWFGPADQPPAFAVLDPDVRQDAGVRIAPGARVTLIGLVRPSPAAEQAMRQWRLDEPTARVVEERGTYLHVTEIRADL